MSELEQTIEELEAEVLAELEEASEKPLGKAEDLGDDPADAAKKAKKASDKPPSGADKAESVPGKKDELNAAAPESKVKPIEKAVNDPDDSLGSKASKPVKTVPHKTGGTPDKMPKALAAGDEVDHDGEELKENKKVTKAQHLENIAKMKRQTSKR